MQYNDGITGLLYTKRDTLFFREDWYNGAGYVAWSIYDKPHKPLMHRWTKLPKGYVEVFDGSDPPRTVSYIPELL